MPFAQDSTVLYMYKHVHVHVYLHAFHQNILITVYMYIQCRCVIVYLCNIPGTDSVGVKLCLEAACFALFLKKREAICYIHSLVKCHIRNSSIHVHVHVHCRSITCFSWESSSLTSSINLSRLDFTDSKF